MTYYANFSPNELMEALDKIKFDNSSNNHSPFDLKGMLQEIIRKMP